MDRTEYAEANHFGMSTVMTHRAYGPRAGEALRAVQAECERLEELLSRFRPGSDVSRVNRSAGIHSERIGDETFEVLARAKELSGCCRGLFDVTIAPLVVLWSAGKETGEEPNEAAIRQTLPLVDYAGLLLDPAEKTAMLKKPDQAVDLGGIGKGYAGDRFLEVFRKYGVPSAFTNIGGNVAALGAKPDGTPWRVGIRHPRREEGLIGLVCVEDRAVVTSGDYQRYFIDGDGKRRHHILDPRTGYPAESGIVSATVVADSSMDADALSTMLFIAGREKGLELLKRFDGAEAVVIDGDLRAHVTAGLRERFQAAEGIDVEIVN